MMPNRIFGYAGEALLGAWPWIPAIGAMFVFGQTDTGLPIPKLDFGSLSATAILGWYAWHTTTYTVPGIVKEFRAELKETREQFFRELREARDHYRSPPPPDQL